jgi:hypothetical protein
MTRLLLDHPWPIDAALDARSEGLGVLLEFAKLIQNRSLTPVPFIDHCEYSDAMLRLNTRRRGIVEFMRFAHHCVRDAADGPLATPVPEPDPPPSRLWKQALREELENPANWRVPQIIVPKIRRDAWHIKTAEVPIRSEDRPDDAPDLRLLATLEEYASHSFAATDLDPWCAMEALHAPAPGARIAHPCVLPKPPCLDGATLDEISAKLTEAHRAGCKLNGRHYFLPSITYRPETIDQRNWRSGRAFEHKRTPDLQRGGPVDYQDQIWAWDHIERHWDVQLPGGGYFRISHDGRYL